jgi:hypothetical protein
MGGLTYFLVFGDRWGVIAASTTFSHRRAVTFKPEIGNYHHGIA